MNFFKYIPFFIIFAAGLFFHLNANNEKRSPYLEEAGKINAKVTSELRDLYNIQTMGLGFGNGYEGKVQDFYIHLKTDQVLDICEARRLTLAVIDHYLNAIRAKDNFLEKYAVSPFDEGNIDIIFSINYQDKFVEQGLISTVFVARKEITFQKVMIENGRKLKTTQSETIEEARKKILLNSTRPEESSSGTTLDECK